MDFPNLSFSLALADSTSPQFRLQAQALNHYVSGLAHTPSISKTNVPTLTLEPLLSSALPFHTIHLFLLSSFYSAVSLSISVSAGVKCKAETGHGRENVCVCTSSSDPWDRPLSGLRTSPAFVSPGQQEREEEQTFNKNIVCPAWRQSAALYTTEEESGASMLASKGSGGQQVRWDGGPDELVEEFGAK